LAVLSAAGVNLSIANYWPIVNGSYTDYIGGMSLTPVGSVASVTGRWNNSNSSFETVSNSYAQAPASNYFLGTSFSVTMWIKIPSVLSYTAVWDFGNGVNVNNVFFSTDTTPAMWMGMVTSGITVDTRQNVAFPTGV
jgi:hypothetical protein